MQLGRVLAQARKLMEQTVRPGETVVDATAGNGHDTLFLAELAGPGGHVLAFDIQQEALDSTRIRLGALAGRADLILDSHDRVADYTEGPVGGAMFNLGFLPNVGDRSVITQPDTTVSAVHNVLGLLKKGGLITVCVYDGHEGGDRERDALLAYASRLPEADVDVARYELVNQKGHPPFLVAFEKKKEFKEPILLD
ncbi:class I SAM-dependent methyltransferase [Bhargavaea beijingensis]|uniref:Methyltransferase domain-containing protein n=1 Tax=Bhargavaea beijingensis TaxID=426756 RepID=A0A1G7EMU9_9BACL|nr:class I SAM-dependent methyltransferase [Bhargavaea beijingensis]MCW1928574.1 methyltransferase domain-containing protein [Bhargavaea beijingensis]RSK25321.1 methyltransferase domain-containing protein [Bhargavaea beijingensis]SDE64971.1 Putative rRNA methylase [Bhargavaea beijingensis]